MDNWQEQSTLKVFKIELWYYNYLDNVKTIKCVHKLEQIVRVQLHYMSTTYATFLNNVRKFKGK